MALKNTKIKLTIHRQETIATLETELDRKKDLFLLNGSLLASPNKS